ncbi:hypothetical protein [Rubricoccus marinus]|uniref:Uncharacterized protein n=1 Tax=Rubricoccus marinus TaxID=716817 RepID=A0A259U1W3_9BACT|nr:hypothetical protein [Rubricoccus marinus]OZC03837.1 hypothetical protein BSZ36_13080 [Rubricoccus marinus]
MTDEPINFYKEAFMSPLNLGFLIFALVTALLIAGPMANILLLFAAAAELLYLGTIPRSDRYKRLVRSRKIAERKREVKKDRDVFRSLSKDDQKRYVRFRNMEKAIKDNFGKLPYSSQGILDAHLKKLDGLLDAYLNLLQLKERYVRFTERTGERDIVLAIDGLQQEMKTDPPRVRAIKQRRMGILEKRLERFKKAGENLAIIGAQLETIEDVTRYVYEQSLTMQNPEEVSFQLDTLVSEVEETQASVEALEDAFGDPMAGLTSLDMEELDLSFSSGDVEDRIDSGLLDDIAPEASGAAERRRTRRSN